MLLRHPPAGYVAPALWPVFNNEPGFLENLSFTTPSYYRNTLKGSMFIDGELMRTPVSA